MIEYIVAGSKGYIGSRLKDMLSEKQRKIKVINYQDFESVKFVRLKKLSEIIENNLVGSQLKWK